MGEVVLLEVKDLQHIDLLENPTIMYSVSAVSV